MYPADPDEVATLFASPAFLTARANALDHRDLEILECRADAAHMLVRYVRSVPVTVPDFAARFLSPRTTIVQSEEWGAASADGARSGTWTITAKGVPVTMRGEMTLRVGVAAGEAAHHVAGTIRVAIPVIGSRLKGVLAADTLATIDAEYRFGCDWLGAGG